MTRSILLLLSAIGLAMPASAHDAPVVRYTPYSLTTAAAPEEAGFDSQRLRRLRDYVGAMVDKGVFAGATTLLARRGKIVTFDTFGRQEVGGTPMRRDTIFRIYSMTKPITGVALMMLFEEGKFRLDDPISMHLPEFKDLKVITGFDGAGRPILEDAKRPPTIRELMDHNAGYGYGLSADSPTDKLYRANAALVAPSMDEFVRRASRLPLIFQPGSDYSYSLSVDIQGALVAKLSGRRFGDFLEQRLFRPLKMTDTAFFVPRDKLGRLAGFYNGVKDGKIQPAATVFGWPKPDSTVRPGFESGGAGLYSTTMDYARFCQMLLNGGELDGVRILSPATVALMSRNHLPDAVLAKGSGGFSRAQGFGLDVQVVADPVRQGGLMGEGTYSWGGAAGTWFWVDPTNEVIFVGMVQRFDYWQPDHPNRMASPLVYQALVRP
ncbi:beta-lactamase family protein [Sphingomonas piscis]|uniref:Beta-lactamase family protein n=1 Tax=Sphingomonas piscis TaxID=2714943 RepID=A0A6G7YPZ6_9SPHN|nr:serine hydrolase domain-containing protein [Sphingomonas piscis]QIK78806.1 beta-lactamase family protein [Sphingomonas piscis]